MTSEKHDFIRQTIWVNGVGDSFKIVCFTCGLEGETA
jgi:hypothetical protein